MRKQIVLLGMVACIVLAGCQPVGKQTSHRGDPLYTTQSSQSNLGEQNSVDEKALDITKQSEQQQALLGLIHQYYKQLVGVSLNYDLTTTTEAGDYHIQQISQELYSDGALKGYDASFTFKVNDQSYSQQAYYDGTDYYAQAPHGAWQKDTAAKAPTTYLFLVKLLLEGQDTISYDEGLEYPIMKKTITDATQLKTLSALLNLPVSMTPNASYQVEAEYQISKDTGQIMTAFFNVGVTDLGQTYQFKVRVVPQEEKELTEIKVDTTTSEPAVTVEDDKFLDTFKTANPIDVLNMYELVWSQRAKDQSKTWLLEVNTWNGQFHMATEGELVDQKITNYHVLANGKRYSLENDTTPVTADAEMTDFYRSFVERFISRYSQLEKVKPSETEGEQPATTTTYREVFNNDPEQFKQAAGKMDVSNLIREQEAGYVIEYVVNNASLQLEAVYFWSLVQGETSIENVNSLGFSRLNQLSPSIIQQLAPEKIWEAIK